MIGFKDTIWSIAKAQKRSAIDIASSFELIGSAKPELLKSAEALGKVTDASITLSNASGLDLVVSADALTSTLNQFNLKADESTRVINALAAGSKFGAAAIPSITEAIRAFGAVADFSKCEFRRINCIS